MFMQHSVPLYGSHGLVYVLAHPRRQHYHHPACLGPSPRTVTPERLIKCASDPFLLIPEVVSPSGTLASLIRAFYCRLLSPRPRLNIFMFILTLPGMYFYIGCSE